MINLNVSGDFSIEGNDKISASKVLNVHTPEGPIKFHLEMIADLKDVPHHLRHYCASAMLVQWK